MMTNIDMRIQKYIWNVENGLRNVFFIRKIIHNTSKSFKNIEHWKTKRRHIALICHKEKKEQNSPPKIGFVTEISAIIYSSVGPSLVNSNVHDKSNISFDRSPWWLELFRSVVKTCII